MNLLEDSLLRSLERLKLIPVWARASAPEGGRRGRAVGSGMEFAEHREYVPGDDMRHLDVNAYARVGKPYLKQYSADKGLDVVVLVDRSMSMAAGSPTKLDFAASLAGALAYVAVGAGDRLRLGAFGGGRRIQWRPPISSGRHVPAIVAGLQSPESGASNLRAVASETHKLISGPGITIILSDWWTEEASVALQSFAAPGREVIAVQILTPEEEEPGLGPTGAVRLFDAETQDRLDLLLDDELITAYRAALHRLRGNMREASEKIGGRLLTTTTSRSLEELLLGEWVNEGLLG